MKYIYYTILVIFSFEQLFRLPAHIFPYPIRLTQFLTIILFVLIITDRIVLKHKITFFSGASLFFIGYWFINLVSISYSPIIDASIRQFLILTLAGVTFYTFYWVTKEFGRENKIFRAILYGLAIHNVVAIIQLFLYLIAGIEVGIPSEMGAHLKIRLFGWMFEPNWYGVFLVAVFPLLFYANKNKRKLNINSTLITFAFSSSVLALILNQSRGAWLAVFIEYVVWSKNTSPNLIVWFKKIYISFLTILGVLTMGGLFSGGSLLIQIIERFQDFYGIGSGYGAANQRLANYIQLGIEFNKNPFFGNGIGFWPSLPFAGNDLNSIPTTTFMYILAEVGIVGFTLFIIGIYLYYRNLKYRLNKKDDLFNVFKILVIGMAIMGLVVEIKTIFSYFPIFAVIYALIKMRYESITYY